MNMRTDGYINAVLGHSLKNKDPAAHFVFANAPIMTDKMLTNLFIGNSLARKIINLPADEAVKNWVHIEAGDQDEQALQMHDDLRSEMHFADALRWSRLYGGSVILMMADDGQLLDEPLNENKLQKVESLRVYDRTQVYWNDMVLYDDPRNPMFGRPAYYQINPIMGTPFLVHESRLLLFTGDPLPELNRLQYQGWGLPALQGMWDELLGNAHSHKLALLIMERMSQGVLKLDGLLDVLMREGGEETVRKRIELIDMVRSVLNTIAIDKEDEYELRNISLAQIPELLDRFGLAVSATSNIPFTLLFGRSPAGMNATGQSDMENFYNMVRNIQKRQVKPNLDRLTRLLMLCKDGMFKGREPENWRIEFNPLWLPSDKEQAETDKLKADAKKSTADERIAYVSVGALDASELRKKLAEEGEYDIDLTLLPEELPDSPDPAEEA